MVKNNKGATMQTAHMTLAARSMADKIGTRHPDAGVLEHWSTSMSDSGLGCFTFGDQLNAYKVTSDGFVHVEPHMDGSAGVATAMRDLEGHGNLASR
jgi:hypothetical protein